MSTYFSYFLYDQVFVPTVIFLVSDNAASVQADCTHFSFLCQCYNQRSQVSLMHFSQTPSLQSFSFTQSFKFCMSKRGLAAFRLSENFGILQSAVGILLKPTFTSFCFEEHWPSKNIAFEPLIHKILMHQGKKQ